MVSRAKKEDIKKQVKTYNYRPFDNRFTIYNAKILQRARKDIMDNFLDDNLAITTPKNSKQENFNEVLIANSLVDKHLIGHQTFVFPLFIYQNNKENNLFEKTGLQQANFSHKLYDNVPTGIEPERVFNYIYAILYSNIYRQKYNEFLKIDFPKIPFTKNENLFYEMAALGKELINLHLLKSEKLEKSISKFPIVGDNVVRKREYNPKEKRVFINNKQYFDGVKSEVWDYYIGGYQVLDKWLKDRFGRTLSTEDIIHYLKIITALNHTIKIQRQINVIYPKIEEKLLIAKG